MNLDQLRTDNGRSLFDAMRDLTHRHAEHLEQLGPVRVLALDPCPRCRGSVMASETTATCRNCGWTLSRVADA